MGHDYGTVTMAQRSGYSAGPVHIGAFILIGPLA